MIIRQKLQRQFSSCVIPIISRFTDGFLWSFTNCCRSVLSRINNPPASHVWYDFIGNFRQMHGASVEATGIKIAVLLPEMVALVFYVSNTHGTPFVFVLDLYPAGMKRTLSICYFGFTIDWARKYSGVRRICFIYHVRVKFVSKDNSNYFLPDSIQLYYQQVEH